MQSSTTSKYTYINEKYTGFNSQIYVYTGYLSNYQLWDKILHLCTNTIIPLLCSYEVDMFYCHNMDNIRVSVKTM